MGTEQLPLVVCVGSSPAFSSCLTCMCSLALCIMFEGNPLLPSDFAVCGSVISGYLPQTVRTMASPDSELHLLTSGIQLVCTCYPYLHCGQVTLSGQESRAISGLLFVSHLSGSTFLHGLMPSALNPLSHGFLSSHFSVSLADGKIQSLLNPRGHKQIPH